MTTDEVRQKYLDFFQKREHKIIPSASLVPEDDPTTLFTGSGMQPLLPYLLGKPHPLGKRIVNSQRCFRALDIEEVGDDRHTTFFEMLGNWSLGDYFKKEQLTWLFEFLTQELNLAAKRLYVTVFRGSEGIPRDTETANIWKELFASAGIAAKDFDNAEEKGMQGGRIFYYDATKNWWSRVGVPQDMPIGEPGGPDSEVFYDFGEKLRLHEKSKFKNKPCHLNCDCGRFFEIGNSVFMTYRKMQNRGFAELPKKNIDFGGGLERMVATTENQPDMFMIDSFAPIIDKIEEATGKKYVAENKASMQIIADHLKAAAFFIKDGIVPANKEQGYFLRRLLRRAAVKMRQLQGRIATASEFELVSFEVLKIYQDIYFEQEDKQKISSIIKKEIDQFAKSLEKGFKLIKKQSVDKIDAKFAFDLFQSYGFPFEISQEIFAQKGVRLDKKAFAQEYRKHQKVSKKGAEHKFTGGLADHSAETVKLHTATHILHQALRGVLGKHVQQKGSNITKERLRFDFMHTDNLTEDEISKVEQIVNQKVKENLTVWSETLGKDEALKLGALAFFGEKYADKVNVYFIGKKGKKETAYSKEFCGGPHVNSTGALGSFKIIKEQSAGAGIRRIYAKLE